MTYVDPARPAACRVSDIAGGDHAHPPPGIGLTATADADVRSGAYRLTHRQQDGRWVYERTGSPAPDRT